MRRVPLWLWGAVAAILLPALLIVTRDTRTEVVVVGAGAISAVREQDAPVRARYVVSTKAREPVAQTAARIERAVVGWPEVVVIGLDGRALGGGEAPERELRETLERLTSAVENAMAVPLVTSVAVPPDASEATRAAAGRLTEWWRTGLCRAPGLRLCVDLAPHAGDPDAVRKAVAAGVADALSRREVLRASTQEGR